MQDRRIKKNIQHIGFHLQVQRERHETDAKGRNQKVSKFRREGGVFSNPAEASAHAARYFSTFKFRVVGVRIDATPMFFATTRDQKSA